MSERYQLIEVPIMLVHFEKGHMLPTSEFGPTGALVKYPTRLSQLARGYASMGGIILNTDRYTWIEKVRRPVWHRLATNIEDIEVALAEEVRPILIHQEHHNDAGPYACDCAVVLENPDARVDQHVWRSEL